MRRAGNKPTMSFVKRQLYLYVHEYFPRMQVCAPCTCLMPVEARRELKALGTGVIDSREPKESNPGPLKE